MSATYILRGTDTLRVTHSDATPSVHYHASWTDRLHATPWTVEAADRDNTILATVTPSTIVPAGGSTYDRTIELLTGKNTHATLPVTVLIEHVGDVTVQQETVVLKAGEYFKVVCGTLFVYDAGGGVKSAVGPGRHLKTTILTGGTSHTTDPEARKILVRLVGGGAGGGGCTSVAAAAGAAGGGGGGSYAERLFAVLPNTAYSYVIGALGAGVSGAAGANATASTFTVSGVTVTAPGGTGGPVATAATTLTARAGGAGGAIATNGDINGSGSAGVYGVVLIVATPIVASGKGGDSVFGSGGLGLVAVGAGNNAVGPGAGGGGAATGASTVRTGGSGTNGIIIVEEYA